MPTQTGTPSFKTTIVKQPTTTSSDQSCVISISPSASELSSDGESDIETNDINNRRVINELLESKMDASSQDRQRKYSERRPRVSSTTSPKETSTGAFGYRCESLGIENESEPFSQVFINIISYSSYALNIQKYFFEILKP